MTTITDYCMNCMEPLIPGQSCSCGFTSPSAAIAHHLTPGTVLANNRYLVGRALGQGGFGITYIGRDLTLNMRIAIKEYYPASCASRNCKLSPALVPLNNKARSLIEAGRQRFLNEARVLAKFHGNPGIVDVRDFFEQNGTAYIVMDYLEGETLKEHLEHAIMSADEVFILMKPIMEALSLVHAEHVIHRDISPDNIMLCKNGKLCLMDFGAARDMDYDNRSSISMVLKSGYAPEEQYRAKGELGPWSDVYSLCATMYKAITGVAPDESLQRLIEDDLVWPSEMGLQISSAQERVLKKGMEPRQLDRYQSIDEMVDDLARGDDCIDADNDQPGSETSSQPDGQPIEPIDVLSEASKIDTPVSGQIEEAATPTRHRSARALLVLLCALLAAVAAGAFYALTPAYTVSFDSSGGTPIAPVTINRIDEVQEPEAPSKDTYVFAGWYLDDALNEQASFPLKANADLTLYAAWDKLTASYHVEYRDVANGNLIATTKSVNEAEVGKTVSESAPDIDGFALESKRKAKLAVSEDEAENIIVFNYRKLVSYTVKYLAAETDEQIMQAKTVEENPENAEATETAPYIAGYTLKSESPQTITLKSKSEKNVITFYYEPIPIQPSYPTNTSTKPSNNGNSKPSKTNDVKWAN